MRYGRSLTKPQWHQVEMNALRTIIQLQMGRGLSLNAADLYDPLLALYPDWQRSQYALPPKIAVCVEQMKNLAHQQHQQQVLAVQQANGQLQQLLVQQQQAVAALHLAQQNAVQDSDVAKEEKAAILKAHEVALAELEKQLESQKKMTLEVEETATAKLKEVKSLETTLEETQKELELVREELEGALQDINAVWDHNAKVALLASTLSQLASSSASMENISLENIQQICDAVVRPPTIVDLNLDATQSEEEDGTTEN